MWLWTLVNLKICKEYAIWRADRVDENPSLRANGLTSGKDWLVFQFESEHWKNVRHDVKTIRQEDCS